MPPTAKAQATEMAAKMEAAGPASASPAASVLGSTQTGRRTPAGLQPVSTLAWRRAVFAAVNIATLAALAYGLARLLGPGGWSGFEIGLFACVMLSAPWTILGFWSAVIGLVLRHATRDPIALVSPHWTDAPSPAPLTDRIAVLMTLRNEDPDRAFRRLLALRADLDRTPDGRRYDLFILSDSDQPDVIAREIGLFDANRATLNGLGAATYRRRADNTGYKAGNVADFLKRWGGDYDLMAPLDADSMMSAGALNRLAQLMRRHPRIGILQTLALGAPAESPFGRIFQFGVRISQRAFAIGSAWWQGDAGPYWGHNAMIRVRPFIRHCDLPQLPGAPPLGGPILSHDQVEAALMRRAGYEVRVAPVELESWEENPVTLLDFIKREQRWCNGNMQYGSLLGLPGLRPANRFQLLQAMLMYVSAPAWIFMIGLAALQVSVEAAMPAAPFPAAPTLAEPDGSAAVPMPMFNATLAMSLFAIMVFMSLAPKLLGAIDVALEPGGVRRFGGTARFVGGLFVEILFGVLLAPAVALQLTIFMLGLPFGRKIGWSGQIRDAYGLEWRTAFRGLWAQTLAGLTLLILIGANAPGLLVWGAPVIAGLILSIPFAVVTASPALGAWMARVGLCASPEEIAPAPTLEAVARMRPRPALA